VITYVIAQRKQLGGGAIADGETDAKKRQCRQPLILTYRVTQTK
jgi:hypothetical protein